MMTAKKLPRLSQAQVDWSRSMLAEVERSLVNARHSLYLERSQPDAVERLDETLAALPPLMEQLERVKRILKGGNGA